MPELKPCPFCGGKAKFINRGNFSSNFSSGFQYTIKCIDCDITLAQTEEMHFHLSDNGEPIMTEASKFNRERMINAWNRRTNNATD